MASLRETYRARLAEILATITFESTALVTFDNYKRNHTVKPYVFITDGSSDGFELMDNSTYFTVKKFQVVVVLGIQDNE